MFKKPKYPPKLLNLDVSSNPWRLNYGWITNFWKPFLCGIYFLLSKLSRRTELASKFWGTKTLTARLRQKFHFYFFVKKLFPRDFFLRCVWTLTKGPIQTLFFQNPKVLIFGIRTRPSCSNFRIQTLLDSKAIKFESGRWVFLKMGPRDWVMIMLLLYL